MGSRIPPSPSFGAETAQVITAEGTASLAYADLATVGPTITIELPSGRALVIIGASQSNNVTNDQSEMSFALDGGAPNDADGTVYRSNPAGNASRLERSTLVETTRGAHTLQAKYKAITGGTATFGNRRMTVVPL